jgi:Na+-transporting NADH:ubiquinone oxidoreductase subunit D
MKEGPGHSSRNARTMLEPLAASNPVTVHVLGLCSALAVSISLVPALIMCAAVICVLTFSNVMVSLLRHAMPHSIRLIMEVTLIATAVIIVDEVLKAFAPDIAEVLSVFVGLIITNCIILARVESFAMHNGVWASFLDGIGNGLGYSWVLLLVAAVRELLGSGSLLGIPVPLVPVPGDAIGPNELMLMSPSAFFLVALVVWGLSAWRGRRGTKPAGPEPSVQSHNAGAKEQGQ